jgi:XTP/dITP diphosphohydrolase
MQVILATTNPAKVNALAGLLPASIHVKPLPDESVPPTDLEDLDSLSAIAETKATFWSRALPDELILATDGGLEIPALPDWQPARTARFAGPDATNRDRAYRLIEIARDLTGSDRTIFWREAIAIARDGRLLASWEASGPPGRLAESVGEVDISNGFWIPAIWICPEMEGRRLSEVTNEEKRNRSDHWTHLARELVAWAERQAN